MDTSLLKHSFEAVTPQLRITGVKDFDSKNLVKVFSDFDTKKN